MPDQAQISIDFNNARPRARFLFGAEVGDYMEEISMRCISQRTIDAVTRQSGDVMRHEDIQRYTDNNTFFAREASSGASDLFGRYLDFSQWR